MALFKGMAARLARGFQGTPRRDVPVAPGKMAGLQAPFQQPMNQIQVPDLSRKLVTRYGLREKSPTPTLAAEVVPVVIVDDLVGESDLIRPRIRPCAGTGDVTPVAQTVVMGLVNPAGSGVVVHLYYFIVQCAATVLFDIHFTGTPATNIFGASGFRNGLLPAQTPAGFIGGSVTGVSPGGVVFGHLRGGITSNVFPFDCVLDEGQGVQLRTKAGAVSSTQMDSTWIWSEEDKK